MSDNEISNKILRSLLFTFGIPNANEGDLFDASKIRGTVDMYRKENTIEESLSFIPLAGDEVRTRD